MLARAESVAILRDRVPGLAEADADRLAAELGDLPLAIAQAAGYMAETGMPAAEYLDLLRTRAGQLLDQGQPASYPRSLAAVDPADRRPARRRGPGRRRAGRHVRVPGPRTDPRGPVHRRRRELPGELAARAADPLAWRQILARLARQSLARIDQRGLLMHRLTQAILRDRLPGQAAATRQWPRRSWPPADPGDPVIRSPGPLGAAAAAPAGRRPGRHRQPGPALDGLRRVLVPAGPRRHPHRP